FRTGKLTTDNKSKGGATARGMTNIFAIAQRELKSYFASPIAYVLIGFYALMFGWFFAVTLSYFLQMSLQMGMSPGGGSINVNQQMIRPILMNVGVVGLFVLPVITMRTYAEEKRSGTIELLLTSPVTDFQIILGKFLGAIGLYATMLLVTFISVGMLFVYGNPEWRPIAVGYLGLLLLGGCFISVGLLISSFTKSQVLAAFVTFAVFLLLWLLDWLAPLTGPKVEKILSYVSLTQHFDDFAKGVLDSKHLVYYLSFITFGLFLTARSVDSERWRG
ncbi:MAG: ABC transporter permease, partial [Acidimicrobiia bacterium]